MCALAIKSEVPKVVESLDDLAQQINEEVRAADKAYRIARAANDKGSAHAIAAGRLLAQAKEKVERGKWLSWIIQNCDVKVRTAQLYMQLAEKHDTMDTAKAQRVAHLALREAAKEVAEPRLHTIRSSPVDSDHLKPTVEARVTSARPPFEEPTNVLTAVNFREAAQRGQDTWFLRNLREVTDYIQRADPEHVTRILHEGSASAADLEELSSWAADIASKLNRME